MLLSSVNFVAKPKAGKAKKVAEKKQIVEEKPTECEMCRKEVSIRIALTRLLKTSGCLEQVVMSYNTFSRPCLIGNKPFYSFLARGFNNFIFHKGVVFSQIYISGLVLGIVKPVNQPYISHILLPQPSFVSV